MNGVLWIISHRSLTPGFFMAPLSKYPNHHLLIKPFQRGFILTLLHGFFTLLWHQMFLDSLWAVQGFVSKSSNTKVGHTHVQRQRVIFFFSRVFSSCQYNSAFHPSFTTSPGASLLDFLDCVRMSSFSSILFLCYPEKTLFRQLSVRFVISSRSVCFCHAE